MSSIQTKLTLTVVFVFAFFWGYRKDQLHQYFVGISSPKNSTQENSNAEPESNNTPIPARIGIPASVGINKTTPTNAKRFGQTPPSSSSPQSASPNPGNPLATGKEYLPPANPYQGLTNQLKANSTQESFKEAFGSIKRDSISQQELIKKNAYFRKLSEDLKTLQGEAPPAAQPEAESEVDQATEIEPELEETIPLEEDSIEGQGDIAELGGAPNDEATELIDELDSLIDESIPPQ